LGLSGACLLRISPSVQLAVQVMPEGLKWLAGEAGQFGLEEARCCKSGANSGVGKALNFWTLSLISTKPLYSF
jgi:hypothetical protein